MMASAGPCFTSTRRGAFGRHTGTRVLVGNKNGEGAKFNPHYLFIAVLWRRREKKKKSGTTLSSIFPLPSATTTPFLPCSTCSRKVTVSSFRSQPALCKARRREACVPRSRPEASRGAHVVLGGYKTPGFLSKDHLSTIGRRGKGEK